MEIYNGLMLGAAISFVISVTFILFAQNWQVNNIVPSNGALDCITQNIPKKVGDSCTYWSEKLSICVKSKGVEDPTAYFGVSCGVPDMKVPWSVYMSVSAVFSLMTIGFLIGCIVVKYQQI